MDEAYVRAILEELRKEVVSAINYQLEDGGRCWELPDEMDRLFADVYFGKKPCVIFPGDGSEQKLWMTWPELTKAKSSGVAAVLWDPRWGPFDEGGG